MREVIELRRTRLNKPCLCFALLIGIAAPVMAEDYCTYDFPLDSNPTPMTSEDVCNFHQVDAQLYRGGRPRPSAYPKLVQIGVRTIINLEEPEYAAEEKAAIDKLNLGLPADKQIQFVSFPISPAEIDEQGVSDRRLRELFGEIQSAGKPIFLHCYHGKDRTGMTVGIYRLLMNQKSAADTYDEAYHYRFSRQDHGLSRTLDRYKSAKRLRTLPRPEPAK